MVHNLSTKNICVATLKKDNSNCPFLLLIMEKTNQTHRSLDTLFFLPIEQFEYINGYQTDSE